MDSTFIALRSYPAKIHADLARSALEASGINAFVRGGDGSSARWVPGNPIEVWVNASDVARANEILGSEKKFPNSC